MAKRTKFQIRSDAARQRWHVRDDQKEGYWRGHLDAWCKSGLSKRAYCTENKLAYSSFMAWRREVELRDREKEPPANVAALLSKSTEKPGNPFVPIRVVPDKALRGEYTPVRNVAQRQQIEIELPSGAVMRLPDGCDPIFVGKLLAQLKG